MLAEPVGRAREEEEKKEEERREQGRNGFNFLFAFAFAFLAGPVQSIRSNPIQSLQSNGPKTVKQYERERGWEHRGEAGMDRWPWVLCVVCCVSVVDFVSVAAWKIR